MLRFQNVSLKYAKIIDEHPWDQNGMEMLPSKACVWWCSGLNWGGTSLHKGGTRPFAPTLLCTMNRLVSLWKVTPVAKCHRAVESPQVRWKGHVHSRQMSTMHAHWSNVICVQTVKACMSAPVCDAYLMGVFRSSRSLSENDNRDHSNSFFKTTQTYE